MLDLHRHTEFSRFDGFGKCADLAKIAKENGLEALGISDHGVINGLVEHYNACKEVGIKPILGCECYYQPKFSEEKRSFHLCLFAKNYNGYINLNRIITLANKNNFYYNARVTDDLLAKYHENLICSTACIGSIFSQLIIADRLDELDKYLQRFKGWFGKDFYVEIMPYSLPEEGLQEEVNIELIKAAQRNDVPFIFTSDSHYGSKEDFDTYCKMHEIAKHGEMALQYRERYIPRAGDLERRFVSLHSGDLGTRPAQNLTEQARLSMKRLVDSVDIDILDSDLKHTPIYSIDIDGSKELIRQIKLGLKKRGHYDDEEYRERAQEEYKVIKHHGYCDYFLIVQDYVNWAKSQGIKVGPGRGSACNSLVAYLLGITDVDSIRFDLDFSRFMRMDKKKEPDIDIDFETARRQEVIDYVLKKYKGKAAQICSYGLYKVDNCLNDLFKVCGVADPGDKAEIKRFVKSYMLDSENNLLKPSGNHYFEYKRINKEFDGVLKHFSKLYNKVRYIGTHAAGVAVTDQDFSKYFGLELRQKKMSCVYDLKNLEAIGVTKFDMLGLITMAEIRELEELTKEKFSEEWLDDEAIYTDFREGKTDGIFQFERDTVKRMLNEIDADCFEDLTAANAMNRPGPLSLGMPEKYAENKKSLAGGRAHNNIYYIYTKKTYGTIVYQEQIINICRNVANMSWEDTDLIINLMKNESAKNKQLMLENEDRLRSCFIKGCLENGMTIEEAKSLFSSVMVYSFNKGHATAYTLISFIQMWYKHYFPEMFWFVKLRYANDHNIDLYKALAVHEGVIIMLPHVNATAETELVEVNGEVCIQEGLSNIKGVGLKAAQEIEKEREHGGEYKNYQDVVNRNEKRIVNNRVLNALESTSALKFNKKKYLKDVEKYNSSLYGRVKQ